MTKRMRACSLGTLAAVLAASVPSPLPLVAQEAGYKLIVHESNTVTSANRDEVSKIFMKKTSHWSSGTPVQPVDLNDSSPVRERFSKDIHKKSLSAVLAYWRQQIFSGAGVPPPEKGSDAEVMAYVKANPNAVGYVSAGAALGSGVKALPVAP